MPTAKKPKPAPKKPEASPPAAVAEHAELHATVYTLPALLTRMPAGPAITAEQVLLYIDVPTEQLVEMGQKVRTERIDTDTARLYGTAYDFAQKATPAQRRALPGLTEQRLRVSIWAAAHGQKLNLEAQASKSQAAVAQELRATDAAQVKAQALGLREVLFATLFSLTGGQKLRTDELRLAYGRSEKPQELADSLLSLCGLLDRYLSDADPKIAARRAEMLLDGQLAAQGRALAAEVLKRGSSQKAPRTATTNAEVDRWDGINLLLLDQLITIFEAGHALDATVPRLNPQSLRGYFGRSASSKPEPSPALPGSGDSGSAAPK